MEQRSTGQEYWRSLEQLADSDEMREQVDGEFAGYDPEGMQSFSRRRFMQIMAASMALAGLTLNGCRRWPKERLAPYSSNPAERIPGVEVQYATNMEIGGIAQALLATSFDGRPIKLEGNPTHPFAQGIDPRLGASDAFAQASVLELYDPERSRFVLDRSGGKASKSDWKQFLASLKPRLDAAASTQGAGLAILSEITDSPSVAYMKKAFLKAYPKAAWFDYSPVNRDNETAGLKQAYGQPLRPFIHLDSASVVALFDADLLGTHPAHIRYGIDWARRRRTADDVKNAKMSRVYMAESRFSTTGSVVDERLPLRPARAAALVQALAAKLGVNGVGDAGVLSPGEQAFVDAAAADLKKAGPGNAVVAAGESMPAEVHALVAAINDAIGAVGKTVTYLQEPVADRRGSVESITDLAGQMQSGAVQSLVILGGNPAYDAPADLDFAKKLSAVPFTAHLSIYADETSKLCTWHVPHAHYLESWGDARAWDGSVGVRQPLILPLFGGKSPIELLAVVAGDKMTDGEAIVRRTFEAYLDKGDFDRQFRIVLHDGLLVGSASPEVKPTAVLKAASITPAASAGKGMDIRFVADASTYDGRYANNAWLQEMPDPLTKLTWDNAALLSKTDADALSVTNGDMISITVGGRTLEIAVYIMPGQPIGVVGLPLGYGREAGSHIGIGLGFNTYTLRTAGSMNHAAGAEVRKTGASYQLAMTQSHFLIDKIGTDARTVRLGEKHKSGLIIHEASFAEYQANPGVFTSEPGRVSLQLYNPPAKFNTPHAWGMSVDMNACIGCNACVVACQAENNIPVVGKDMVVRNREMQWLRIDRYFKGDRDDPNPQVVYQPMMCQQCENAPCEQVCPVGATMHDTEGLNVMVYNRCIGTRYCSNNCPYKVRRFNYFDWHAKDPRGKMNPWLDMPDTQQREMVNKFQAMVYNPDVTVRMRGVMEKCTYCIQRIHKVTIAKRGQNEPVKDGDIVTACQQVCPTNAIVFGNLNDEDAQVSKLHHNKRTYGVLDDALNTQPRTKYLAKLRNPSEALGAGNGKAT